MDGTLRVPWLFYMHRGRHAPRAVAVLYASRTTRSACRGCFICIADDTLRVPWLFYMHRGRHAPRAVAVLYASRTTRSACRGCFICIADDTLRVPWLFYMHRGRHAERACYFDNMYATPQRRENFMGLEKATAIVIRGSDWSETSRICTMFTREFGKVRTLAKGGRRLRSNFESALDLLTVCKIVFIRKDTAGLDLLTEAQVAERFPRLRKNLAALYAGYYIAELLADGTQDYDPHPDLFDVALRTLRDLDGNANQVGEQVAAFELVWLDELGYRPQLDCCAACQSALTFDDDRLYYSLVAGGMLCEACRKGSREARSLSQAGWAALKQLGQGPTTLDAATHHEVRQLLGATISTVLGRRPRLLHYVDARPTGR